jgi:hypothetical protein
MKTSNDDVCRSVLQDPSFSDSKVTTIYCKRIRHEAKDRVRLTSNNKTVAIIFFIRVKCVLIILK